MSFTRQGEKRDIVVVAHPRLVIEVAPTPQTLQQLYVLKRGVRGL